MKSLTWLKYDFTAEMRPRAAGPNDSIADDPYPPSDIYVSFTLRSNASTTLRILSPEPILMFSALVGITDKHGEKPFQIQGGSSQGDFWIVYHREPIYDSYGNLIYWLQMVKRQS